MKAMRSFTCWGKEVFASFTVADRVRKRRTHAKGASKRDREQVYRCDGCQGYHIGSSIRRRTGRPRAAEEIEA